MGVCFNFFLFIIIVVWCMVFAAWLFLFTFHARAYIIPVNALFCIHIFRYVFITFQYHISFYAFPFSDEVRFIVCIFFVLAHYMFTWVTNYKLQNIFIVFYLLWHCFEMQIQLKYHAHGQSQLVWTDHDLMLMFSVKSIIHSIFTALNIIFRRIYTNWNLIDSERERERVCARWRNQFCKIKVNCQQIEILAKSYMDGMRKNLPKLWVELTQWYNQQSKWQWKSKKWTSNGTTTHYWKWIPRNGNKMVHLFDLKLTLSFLSCDWLFFTSNSVQFQMHANIIFSTVSRW